MDVWLRVLTAVVLVIAPSVLFVALYRGLMGLRDQDLIARLAEAGHLDPASLDGMEGTTDDDRGRKAGGEQRRPGSLGRNAAVNERRAAFLRKHGGPESRSTRTRHAHGEGPVAEVLGARDVVRCGRCGTANAAEFGLCWNCLEWFE